MFSSAITGLGMYLPPRVVTNNDLEKLMETSNEWIIQRSGIEERRWVDADTCTSDLALQASLEAIKDAGIDKSEIDGIVLATISPDHEFPGVGCFLQTKLGLSEIPCLDIRQQCTGFVHAMSIADAFIKSGQHKTLLVVGAEIHSKGLDKTTRGRDVSVLFGDGAGAAIMCRTEVKDPRTDSHIISTRLFADGNGAKDLWVAAPGTALGADRMSKVYIDENLHFPYMNGKRVFTNAVRRMAECLTMALAKDNYTMDDVDLFIFHQANLRINQMIAQEMKIPEHKVFNTIQKFGNTTAATIPIGLCEAKKAGKLKKGTLVATAAFGAGFTWGSALYRY